jgi:hypothetical protein
MIQLKAGQRWLLYGLLGLVAICIVTVVLQSYTSAGNAFETFVGSAAPGPSINFCPMGYTQYLNKSGDSACCDGKVSGTLCLGTPRCGFTTRSGLPLCGQMLKNMYASASKTQCPPSMPNYFQDAKGLNAGCTSGPLNDTMTGPNPTGGQSTCKIYASQEDNLANTDSCYNQRLLEQTPCFGNDCQKSLSMQSTAGMGLVTVEFTGVDGHRHQCYTSGTYTAFLDKTQPNWRSKGTFDPAKSLRICSVAKKVYVDRTMDEKDATA